MNRVDTVAILELVRDYDQREITPDLITEWHEQIGHLPKPAAVEAVHLHYKINPSRIDTQHVIDIAGEIAERKPSQRPMRRARMGAYHVNGAFSDQCPRCGAQPGETCTNPETGHETHAPCMVRLVGKKTAA
ncbi:hypothetical protein [Nocardia flavorosea]|uniref:Uncharacterized protein n=1 Tax=Nocardia flavorosea TaxID=53429 RepID=A0A846YTB6_9NOCA|nr:hypothetical protein [Nocardia flavorosea]NKY60790.1 hypothetical protein [Nocardia flavorosea]